ncbi:hypothetical protein GQS40_09655|uniref:LPXTG cell wall anchor domain-containing protein n=1 Tax=Leuconostoc lactis TaxID=1246 RepID=A0A6L7AGM2_LEULA|nr:hypothetical protein [Leuconostoc lactis]
MIPEVPSVTPENPGEDTPIVYNKVETPTPKTVDVTPETPKTVDVTSHSDIDKYSDVKVDPIKGYYTDRKSVPGEVAQQQDIVNTVVYKQIGKIVPVDPSGNPIPDAPTPQYPPINPNDPNGPKWPAKDSYTKQYTSTVHFVDENGNKLHDDNVQTSTWTRTLIVDKATGEILNPDEACGEKIDYSTTPRIDEWRDKGYRLVEDGFAEAGTPVYDDNDDVEQIFIVKLDHDTAPVGPNDPHEPGTTPNQPVPSIPGMNPEVPAVTPNQPGQDTPVTYVPVVPEKQLQTAKIVYVDTKTGKTLETDTVTGKSDAKVIEGYYLTAVPSNAEGTFGDDNVTVTFTYAKLGKIIPVDPSGNPIPDAPTPQYPNDPTDPTKTVPTIPGMTPEVPSVTPENPGQDTPVVYEMNKHSLTERFVDEAGNELAPSEVVGKDYVKDQKYNVTGDGYYLTAVPSNAEGTFGDDNVTVTFTYAKLGKIIPVDPSGNPIPDAPTPQYPNDPTDPTKTTPDQPGMTPQTPVVTPENPGKDTPVVYEMNKHSLTERFVDEAGNELEAPVVVGTDYVKNDKYNVTGDAKMITAVPSNAEGTFGDDNVTVTFTYAKLGKIIPVDPSGNPIPDAPTPQYPNDPTDPTKTTPNQPVPEIPVPSVTPENPGKDTPVVYEMNKHSLTERFVDEAGNELAPSEVVGKDYVKDQKYNVTGDAKVIDGYYFNVEGTFDDEDVTVTFTYAKLGKIIPVDPSGNPIPDAPTPQYPNDPTDPTKTTPDQPVPSIPGMTPNPGEDTPVVYVPVVEGKYSLIERFVDEAGQEISSTIVKGTEYVKNDKYNVTGDAKVIDGYYLTAVPSDNVTVTFTYAKLGKIIPVDPSGNPIPDAPTPQYPNDPTDPTKTTPNQPVPSIPGMNPEVPAITPNQIYNPVVEKHSLTERFVDEAGNELAPSEVIGTDYVKNDKYNVTGDAKVIDGYYLTAMPSNAEGTFGEVYKPMGKIVPVDPSGNPIPDAPTPQYPNDPTDPTKTTPDQPVPEIPGMTPEVPSVTPENPGKDTPVDVQTSTWTRTLNVDKVTGDVLNPAEPWTPDKPTYDKVNVPVVPGYYADQPEVPAKPTVQENITDKVPETYYVTLEHDIAPVGPNNPHEPGTPVNPNDPDGPKWPTQDQYTKDYTSTVEFVDDQGNKMPGLDDEIQNQPVTIIYQDKSENNKVLATDELEGKPGTALDYSTADKIQSFIDKGYKLVSDGVPNNATFGDDAGYTASIKSTNANGVTVGDDAATVHAILDIPAGTVVSNGKLSETYLNNGGTVVMPANYETVVVYQKDMTRDITLDLTADQIATVEAYAATHTADETLNYIKNLYVVSQDSGWQVAEGINTKTAYDAVATPEIKDNQTSPTAKGAKGTAPYYGISTMRASHQIWFPHGTEIQAAGQHQNTIKYVYEDGTEAAPTVTQSVLKIGGTNYVVYQQIKSDGAQQIWLNVDAVEFNKNGFAAKDEYNNGANPDVSISGKELTANILANDMYAELISFPLGAANSVIDIQDPLYLNLQRYSADGATKGWMPVGGTDINSTSAAYTANLIYMGGTKGVYNYIGVNEGGNITVDEYATFRVILTGRGDNPWDDVISLDSRNSSTNAAFTSKKGAIVDIRDDNTNLFTGRDGFILGNNANFTSGEYSNVHFQNQGRGVALDLANNSNIVISKHSNTLFESNGKTGTSGSYDGLNGGNFLTGRNAVVNMNTSIGQAVSIGADRPGIGVTAADRFGGYGTSQSRNAGPTAVTFGDYSQFNANIWGAKSVTVADGANFTLNRSAIGDGINLPDGATVQVGDNATMTVNLNTDNGTESARYHDAGIFIASANGAVTFNNSSNTSTVTFKDVTHSGASLYGGSGNAAVVIDGTTTSTVSTSSKPTAKTYSANGNGALNNPYYQTITVDGTINAMGTGTVEGNDRTVVIKGADQNASIDFGSTPLNVNGTMQLAFENLILKTVTNQATVDNTVNTADQATQAAAEKTTTPASTAANTQAAAPVVTLRAAATADTSTTTTVNNWTGLIKSNVAQVDNSANNATVANNLDKKSITDSTLSNNNDLKSTEMQSTVADQAAADDANTADQTATEKQATVLVGATFFLGSTTSASASDEQLADKQAGVTQQTDQNATNTNDRVLKFDNATSTATTDNADSSAAKMCFIQIMLKCTFQHNFFYTILFS